MLDFKNNEFINLLSDFKAILFDMDGTLINSEKLHAKALQKVLLMENQHISVTQIENDFLGLPDNEVYKRIYSQSFYSLLKSPFCKNESHFISLKNFYYIELIDKMSDRDFNKLLLNDIHFFLRLLKSKALKIGLVSASESLLIQKTLIKANLIEFFDEITPRLNDGPNKPHPHPYQITMDKLKVKPSETLIFEDSPTGLEAAYASQAKKVILVENFHHHSSGINEVIF
jgi:beta-phosphoglucomutase-like phosphatase (HAD superfamily)